MTRTDQAAALRNAVAPLSLELGLDDPDQLRAAARHAVTTVAAIATELATVPTILSRAWRAADEINCHVEIRRVGRGTVVAVACAARGDIVMGRPSDGPDDAIGSLLWELEAIRAVNDRMGDL